MTRATSVVGLHHVLDEFVDRTGHTQNSHLRRQNWQQNGDKPADLGFQ
jgi:hypothetical protein